MILVQQQSYSIGELMRGILRLVAAKSAEEMENQVEFLSTWIGE
jgi:predicted translin family RNA/ssDNA-binding protein